MLIKAATAGLIGEAAMYAVALVAVIAHFAVAARRRGASFSLGAFVRYLLPTDVLFSRWTRVDFLYFILNRFLFALVFPSVAGMVVLTARFVQVTLATWLGAPPAVPQGVLSLTIFLVCGLALRDFASFYAHLLSHRMPLLWEFHKVHHAPESLMPLTGYRLHPFDQFLGMVAETPLFGLLIGSYAWLTSQNMNQLLLLSAGFYSLVTILTLKPLRHSHIDLRLGRLEFLILSPAHHRLHHSIEPHHWNKNFGTIFPLWDWLWHTLAEPPPIDTYGVGLSDDSSVRYASVLACYFAPFREIIRTLRMDGLSGILRIAPVGDYRTPPPASATAARANDSQIAMSSMSPNGRASPEAHAPLS